MFSTSDLVLVELPFSILKKETKEGRKFEMRVSSILFGQELVHSFMQKKNEP